MDLLRPGQRRGWLEIVRKILSVVRDHADRARYTRIMEDARLSKTETDHYISWMLEVGLLEKIVVTPERNPGHPRPKPHIAYRRMPKGEEFFNLCRRLDSLLERKEGKER